MGIHAPVVRAWILRGTLINNSVRDHASHLLLGRKLVLYLWGKLRDSGIVLVYALGPLGSRQTWKRERERERERERGREREMPRWLKQQQEGCGAQHGEPAQLLFRSAQSLASTG